MEAFLKTQHAPDASFEAAFNCALDAWSIGHMIFAGQRSKGTCQARRRCESIDRNNWQLPESKQHCLSAIRAGQYVIDPCRIRNCAR